MQLLIVAKRPLPGRAKTRLIPRFGPEGSAALAAAALVDTFAAARACGADRVVVAFDGDPSGIVPSDFDVVPQVDGDLAARLADAWRHVSGPALQIGMDTPQVTGTQLDAAFDVLGRPGTDAALGLATDGGWWAIGLHRPTDVFRGIETSRHDTGRRQLDRLRSLGLATSLLPTVRDVDLPDDVDVVADTAPHTHFAAAARALGVDTTGSSAASLSSASS